MRRFRLQASRRKNGDDRRRCEFQLVEQFAVIDDQVEPIVERVHRVWITVAGARKFRCIDRVAAGKPRNECTVRPEAPRSMQIDKRRAAAADLDLGRNPVLPEFQPANIRSGHVSTPASGCGGHAQGPALRLEARRPPAVLVLIVPLVLEMREHLAREQFDVHLA